MSSVEERLEALEREVTYLRQRNPILESILMAARDVLAARPPMHGRITQHHRDALQVAMAALAEAIAAADVRRNSA